VAKWIVCGADPERYIAKINEYIDAGYDYVWIHQAGPDQEGFFRFFAKEVFLKLDHDCSLCFQRKNF
jgi:coenzyme F420-dependent glucose-6-phosphate dehydrogenase